jgi:acyl-CoA thioester hydrolase
MRMRVPAPLRAPEDAFVEPLRVRSYEVGETGGIGLGTLLRYLELIATDHSASQGFDHLWYERQGTAWFVRTMDLLLGTPPAMDVPLQVATWVSEFRRVQARREYVITCAETGALVARASARWGYVDRASGRPRVMDDALAAAFMMHPRHVLLPTAPTAHVLPVARERMALVARRYEADTQGHINNTVYGDWLMEALHALWTRHPHGHTGGVPRLRRVRLEYLRPVQAGDIVGISSSAGLLGSRRLEVEQTITEEATGAVCLVARITCLRVP